MATLSPVAQGDARSVAVWDVSRGVLDWRLWAFLGLQDIRQRYRRSSLGPLWLTLGLGVTVLGIGLLYSQILKTASGNYLPYIGLSLLIWNFISVVITESTSLFQGAGHVITSVRVPYTSFVLRAITRNLIVAAHSVIVVIITFAWFRYPVTPVAIAAIPGLILICANLYWMSLLVAILSARYRDVAQIITYAMSIMLFITPVIWQPTSLKPGSAFLRYNPFAQMLELVRGPVYDHRLSLYSYGYVGLMFIVGTVFTLFVFFRSRRYLVYWL